MTRRGVVRFLKDKSHGPNAFTQGGGDASTPEPWCRLPQSNDTFRSPTLNRNAAGHETIWL
jgi:hypothetical protein